jgi:hypothetical protein
VKWWLEDYEPSSSTSSPSLTGSGEELRNRKSRALECVQRPGDIVFVPGNWGHAVINTHASVAIAIEFEAHEH